MKLNNKGFVTSALLYTLLILFISILLGVLALFSNRKMILDKLKHDIKNQISEQSISYPNGTIVYYNPKTNSVCNNYVEETYTANSECLKWYIYNDSASRSNVSMILNQNFTPSGWKNSTRSMTETEARNIINMGDDYSWLTEYLSAASADTFKLNNDHCVNAKGGIQDCSSGGTRPVVSVSKTLLKERYSTREKRYLEYSKVNTNIISNKACSTTGLYFFEYNRGIRSDSGWIHYNYPPYNLSGNVLVNANTTCNIVYACFSYNSYNYETNTGGGITKRVMPCITNRYDNLIVNGDLSYKSNLNFEDFGDYNSDGYITLSTGTHVIRDYIPFDIRHKYGLTYKIKSIGSASIQSKVTIIMYGSDKQQLGTYTIVDKNRSDSNTFITLKGDNVINGNNLASGTKFIRIQFERTASGDNAIKDVYFKELKD